ncbi:MAG TPA: biotin/lipoyl-containing protein [Terriglobales bacterium]|jgi:biotin carboxyl carrier protein
MTYEVIIDGKSHRLELSRGDGAWDCRLDGREVKLDAVLARRDVLSVLIDGKAYEIKRERGVQDLHYWVGSVRYAVEVHDPRSLRSRQAGAADERGSRKLIAPMPGKVVRVLAPENTAVEAGQGVIVVEAMKMQNELKSPKKGVVQKIMAAEGAAVNAGDVLAIVE